MNRCRACLPWRHFGTKPRGEVSVFLLFHDLSSFGDTEFTTSQAQTGGAEGAVTFTVQRHLTPGMTPCIKASNSKTPWNEDLSMYSIDRTISVSSTAVQPPWPASSSSSSAEYEMTRHRGRKPGNSFSMITICGPKSNEIWPHSLIGCCRPFGTKSIGQ